MGRGSSPRVQLGRVGSSSAQGAQATVASSAPISHVGLRMENVSRPRCNRAALVSVENSV